MTSLTFRAMNTEWWVRASLADLAGAELLVRDLEAQLSRFREDSALSRLNRDRHALDATLAEVTRRALHLREATRGAFDPTLGAALLAAGYRRSFEELRDTVVTLETEQDPARPTLAAAGDAVILVGPGLVDFGGIAKGWSVDAVAAWLESQGVESYVVDGGGDIRVGGHDPDGGPWTLGVGDEHAVELTAGAVCTSSIRHRCWRTTAGRAHHILDPRTSMPSSEPFEEAVVVASDAATADALATALLADFEGGLHGVRVLQAEAMVRSACDGEWRMTPGMRGYLR